MKTYIALLLAASVDAKHAGKSSKASSYSYSFSDIGASKSDKSGRILINVDEIESRTLHEGRDGMSYRMFVPSAKALRSTSPKSGKVIAPEDEVMSFPMLSAKSTKFLAVEDSVRLNVGKSIKTDTVSAKSTKSTQTESIFGRLLVELDDSMSYSNVIIAGKSAKLQPKSGKTEFTGANSSKAGKTTAKIDLRAVDPSLNAIDFTRSGALETALATAEESSTTATTASGVLISFALTATYFMM